MKGYLIIHLVVLAFLHKCHASLGSVYGPLALIDTSEVDNWRPQLVILVVSIFILKTVNPIKIFIPVYGDF